MRYASRLYYIIILCSLPLTARYYTNIKLPISIHCVEFAWDLHDVVFKKRIGSIIGKSLKHFKDLAKFKFSRKKQYKQLRREWNDLRKTGATVEVLEQLLYKHNAIKLANIVNKLALQLKVNKEVERIICRFASQRYIQRVATNMGPTILKQLRKSHHVLTHLADGVTGIYELGKQINRKPYNCFYEQYNRCYNLTGKKIIIFIDDKIENVLAAQKAGWIAIHFTSVKSLLCDLQSLGIDLSLSSKV